MMRHGGRRRPSGGSAACFGLLCALALLVALVPPARPTTAQGGYLRGVNLAGADFGSRYFPETGHTVHDRFLDYWLANGGLPRFGYPLTEEFAERLEDGNVYTVQYFERVRMEYHPENDPPYDVLLGHFGRYVHPADRPVAPLNGDWRLVFGDEFDGLALDRTKWATKLPWGRTNMDTGELQSYEDNQFELRDGILRIRADRRTVTNSDGTWQYASGIIDSYDSFVTTYGYFEMRARLPRGQGLWSGFWLAVKPYDVWPPEIDIMENLGQDPYTVYTTYHYVDDATGDHAQVHFGGHTGPDFSADYHVFSMLWQPGLIVWYIDGVEHARTTTAVTDLPMHVLANLAVGGSWPGAPDATTPFPSHYEIDYIRVYQQSSDTPVAPIAGQTYFPETGHNVDARFLEYWRANGGLPQFGYPISELLTETLEDGNTYRVQYFERARFEHHPLNNPPYDVLLGQLGRRVLSERHPGR